MRSNDICYYFTAFGDIYAGYGLEEPDYPLQKIIVPASNLHDYINSTSSDRRRIKDLAWIVPEKSIKKVLDQKPQQITNNIRVSLSNNFSTRKHLFIIGAGASSFCYPDSKIKQFKLDPLCPPLGNELFDEKFSNIYKGFKGVENSLHFL